MPLTPNEIEEIAARTLAHYEQQRASFWEGTRDHDVSQNIAALLDHIDAGHRRSNCSTSAAGPDATCMTFRQLGHRAIGLEGSAQLAAMARRHSGCEVLEQNFLRLDLPAQRFDGVFANAVLFHVPAQELPRMLRQLHATLKPDGVLFSSNPRGDGQEGWNGDRYGAFHDWAIVARLHDGRRLLRTDPLLPAAGPAAGPAAVAGERVAQAGRVKPAWAPLRNSTSSRPTLTAIKRRSPAGN